MANTKQNKEDSPAVQATGSTVKKRKGNNPKGSPLLGERALQVEAGDNSKFLSVNMELFQMENIDLKDPEQVKQRLYDYYDLYFRNDMKPTVAGMALALNGKDRRWLWAVTHDAPYGGGSKKPIDLPREVSDLIKKAYKMLENLWETYMNSGKINPMAGVFLGVNNYNYRDVKQVDVVPTLPETSENDYDAATIRQRYLPDETIATLPENSSEE